MGNIIATFTNPERNLDGAPNGASEPVSIDGKNGFFGFQAELNGISQAAFLISHDITSKFGTETNSANATQLNSTVLVARDGETWFNGFVNSNPQIVSNGGVTSLHVECYGKDGVLLRTQCRRNGEDIWSMSTDSFKLINLPLKPTSNYGSFNGDTLWPDPGDATGIKCYLHNNVSNNDALDVNIGDGSYVITAVDIVNEKFSVADNVPDEFTAGLIFSIDSGPNAGDWTVSSAIWTGLVTEITVVEDITDNTITGNIIQDVIILSTSNEGFKPRGWVVIETEFIYHDSYDNADADGKYRLRGCKRGELESVAAAHLAAVVCYEKLTKQMAPGIVRLEQDTGGGFERLLDAQYAANFNLQTFILPITATGTYRCTYSVYDEDRTFGTHAISGVNQGTKTFTTAADVSEEIFPGDTLVILGSTGNDGDYTVVTVTGTGPTDIVVFEAIPNAVADGNLITTTVLTLNDLIQELMTISVANKGPGFTTAELDLNASRVYVNRYDYAPKQRPKYTWDAIQEIIAQLDLEEDVGFFYDHKLDKFRLIFLGSGASVGTAPFVTWIRKDNSLDNTFSTVRVEYTHDQDLNMASATNSWHQAATGAGTSPDIYQKIVGVEGQNNAGATVTVHNTAGSGGMDVLFDNRKDTKLRGLFTHDPGGSFEFGHWWFSSGTTPELISLEKIFLRFNGYRTIGVPTTKNTAGTQVLRFQGCTDYNTGTNTGTWQDLGFEIENKPAKDSLSITAEATSFTLRSVNAVRLIWDYMAGNANTGYGVVFELKIIGNITQYFSVDLTDQVTDIGDPSKIYAPNTYRKLRGGVNASTGVAGTPRCEDYFIGVASDQSAVSMARFVALTKLRKFQERQYEYRGFLPALPRLGIIMGFKETGGVAADYTGTIRSHSVAVGTDGILTNVGVLDYTVAVLE